MRHLSNRLNREAVLALLFVLLVVGLRFLPHPANFSPTLALLIYLGFAGRLTSPAGGTTRWIWFVGPAIILGSDLILGTYEGMSMVYLSYAICLISGALLTRFRLSTVLTAGLSSSVLFFGLSNFGVWQFTHLYAHDQIGLMQCYVMALPFFHYTVFSTLGGLAVMFGLRAGVAALAPTDGRKIRARI